MLKPDQYLGRVFLYQIFCVACTNFLRLSLLYPTYLTTCMTPGFTHWLEETFLSTTQRTTPTGADKPPYCSGNKEKCLEHVLDLLDGQLSDDDEGKMRANIEACKPCFEEFDIQIAIRQAIKLKVKEQQVPEGLIEEIRSKITTLA